MLSGRFQMTDLRDRHPDSRHSRPFPPLDWCASHAALLRGFSPPDDSYMIPVGVLERRKPARRAG